MSEAIVSTPEEAAQLEHGAAIVLGPLAAFLERAGLGDGPLQAEPIGDGHSNLSFLLRRGEARMVLRRPPRGELASSANDVLREARVLAALGSTSVPVPAILAECEDTAVIGAPFFVMSFVDGIPIDGGLPSAWEAADVAETVVGAMVDALVEIHAADLGASGLDAFGKPTGYLERQLRRFGSLLETNATRPLPELERVADWLARNLPTTSETTFVHGDYRLGNLLFSTPLRLAAVVDWEMATVGDPLADLGYATATWAEPADEGNPMLALSRLSTGPDFPGRAELADRYAQASGRRIDDLPWYQVLALWKSAIFLEGSYRRYRAGASSDDFFASLDVGVPALARDALRLTEGA